MWVLWFQRLCFVFWFFVPLFGRLPAALAAAVAAAIAAAREEAHALRLRLRRVLDAEAVPRQRQKAPLLLPARLSRVQTVARVRRLLLARLRVHELVTPAL